LNKCVDIYTRTAT